MINQLKILKIVSCQVIFFKQSNYNYPFLFSHRLALLLTILEYVLCYNEPKIALPFLNKKRSSIVLKVLILLKKLNLS